MEENKPSTDPVYRVIIPSAYVSYIEYGDAEGLNDSEIDEIDRFLNDLEVLFYEDDEFFSLSNDISSFGATCVYAICRQAKWVNNMSTMRL